MAIENRYLPGGPSPRLAKMVRRLLRGYGVTPQDRYWRLAWEWATTVRDSYYYSKWPMASEIVAQYMVLLLAEMNRNHVLKLPFRAFKMSQAVADALPKSAPLALQIAEDKALDEPAAPLTLTVIAARPHGEPA